MTDGITHNNFGAGGQALPTAPKIQPETLTHGVYDINQPVSEAEDTEAVVLASSSFLRAIRDKMRASFHKGWGGWNRPTECSLQRLVRLLDDAVEKGDVIDIANYTMMLHGRGVTNVAYMRLMIKRIDLAQQIAAATEADDDLRLEWADCVEDADRAALEKKIDESSALLSAMGVAWEKLDARCREQAAIDEEKGA